MSPRPWSEEEIRILEALSLKERSLLGLQETASIEDIAVAFARSETALSSIAAKKGLVLLSRDQIETMWDELSTMTADIQRFMEMPIQGRA